MDEPPDPATGDGPSLFTDAKQRAMESRVSALRDRLHAVERGRNLRAGDGIEVNGAQIGFLGGQGAPGAASSQTNQYSLQSVNVNANGLPATQQLLGLPPVLLP